MINWKQCVYGDNVRIIDIDNDVFEGIVECVTDSEERSNLEKQEIGIGIITNDGRHIEFYESEIASIEIQAISPHNLRLASGK
jgi:hypothetical protein